MRWRVRVVFAVALGACTGQQRDASSGAEGNRAALPPARAAARSVSDVIEGRIAVGDTVVLRGQCLGFDAGRAAGPPPVTRSDWQLADSAAAVFVSGAIPPGCELGGSARPVVVVRGTVARDSIPAFPGQPARARYYVIATARLP